MDNYKPNMPLYTYTGACSVWFHGKKQSLTEDNIKKFRVEDKMFKGT